MTRISKSGTVASPAGGDARTAAGVLCGGFLEVETPTVDAEIIPELYIEPFGVEGLSALREFEASRTATRSGPGGCEPPVSGEMFLQVSPELHMKRLLCEGLPAIYQVTRSFRRGESRGDSQLEFTMVEWYCAADDMAAGMTLLDELCQAVAGSDAAKCTTYAEAFRVHAGVDAHRATCDELAAAARRLAIRN